MFPFLDRVLWLLKILSECYRNRLQEVSHEEGNYIAAGAQKSPKPAKDSKSLIVKVFLPEGCKSTVNSFFRFYHPMKTIANVVLYFTHMKGHQILKRTSFMPH